MLGPRPRTQRTAAAHVMQASELQQNRHSQCPACQRHAKKEIATTGAQGGERSHVRRARASRGGAVNDRRRGRPTLMAGRRRPAPFGIADGAPVPRNAQSRPGRWRSGTGSARSAGWRGRPTARSATVVVPTWIAWRGAARGPAAQRGATAARIQPPRAVGHPGRTRPAGHRQPRAWAHRGVGRRRRQDRDGSESPNALDAPGRAAERTVWERR